MTLSAWAQLALFVAVLLALVKPLGWYMARVYRGEPCGLDRALGGLERLVYRLAGVDPAREMGWKTYAAALLLFSAAGWLFLYALLRLQGQLPLNPQGLPANSPHSRARSPRQPPLLRALSGPMSGRIAHKLAIRYAARPPST